MRYKFLLTVLYKANYKKEELEFLPPRNADFYHVSQWMAAATDLGEKWRSGYAHSLQQEFSQRNPKEVSHRDPTMAPLSWIAWARGQRLFFLEVAEVSLTTRDARTEARAAAANERVAADVFVTAFPGLLHHPPLATEFWQGILVYLRKSGRWQVLRIVLDPSREVERTALLQLGARLKATVTVLQGCDGATEILVEW